MLPLLIGILNRFRPREGWAPFLLFLVALLCMPAALLDADDSPGTASLLLLTILATIVGLRFARSRLSARTTTTWGGLLGVGLVTIIVGRLLPPLSLLVAETDYAVEWLKLQQQGLIGWPLPFASAANFVGQQLSALGIRLWWWAQTAASGKPAQDNIFVLLLAALLVWAFGLFATWQIYRRRSALVGMLPNGAVLTIIAFFAGGMSVFYLLAHLFCTLSLLAICHLWTRRERWEQAGTDYPGNLGAELALALAPMLTVILALAFFFPVVYPNQLRDAFWRVMDGPWSRVERVAERFFGPIDSTYPGSSGARPGTAGQLPRSHLLGSGAELSDTIVLYVSTDDPPPPVPDKEPIGLEEPEPAHPRRYWRSTTYDIYTGLGWSNSPLENRPLNPNQFLEQNLLPGADLLQQFQRLVAHDTQIYVANTPVRVDQPVQTWWRAPDDLAHLTGGADRYTVISRPPEPTTAELRAASPLTASLPPDMAERYLALPDTIPQRVLDLAWEVVGEAKTGYDRVQAIEFYLRAYPYNLELPEPPVDRDLVDYFLFDFQEGYCDYYASAMVVMARAVGMPARLATGYAQGIYDHDTRRWVVTEKDGHSWAEVYFEDIGWVEFEPTAGLPALTRSGGTDPGQITVPALPPRSLHWWQRIPWALVGLGGMLLFLIAIVAWIWRPRQEQAAVPAELVRDRYARLLRWGQRLKQPLNDGQTPHEYGHTLGAALHTRGQDARWPQTRQASAEAPPEITHLTEAFVRTQYSPRPTTNREGWQIRDLWRRLRRRLWWLWLAKR